MSTTPPGSGNPRPVPGMSAFLVGGAIVGLVLGVILLQATRGSDAASTTVETASVSTLSNQVTDRSPMPDNSAGPTATPLPLVASVVADVAATAIPPTAIPVTATPWPTVNATIPTAEPEPTAAPEPTAEPEPTTAPVPTAAPEPTAEPEPTAAPAPTAEPEPTAAPEPTPEPEPTAEPTADVVTEVVSEPVQQITAPVETASSGNQPAWSAGATFNYVLFAGPSIQIAAIHDEPNGQELQVTFESAGGSVQLNDLQNPTYAGNTLALQVLRGEPGDAWAMVSLPTRPSGQTGWVNTAGWDWSSSNYMVRVNITANTVQVWNGSDLIMETGAVTGKSSSRTPLATGFIDEKVHGLGAAYGPVALSFSFYSDDLDSFAGGAPKIALHGTNRDDLIGQHQSNGCIRVNNDDIRRISELVPVGTRVEIVA